MRQPSSGIELLTPLVAIRYYSDFSDFRLQKTFVTTSLSIQTILKYPQHISKNPTKNLLPYINHSTLTLLGSVPSRMDGANKMEKSLVPTIKIGQSVTVMPMNTWTDATWVDTARHDSFIGYFDVWRFRL